MKNLKEVLAGIGQKSNLTEKPQHQQASDSQATAGYQCPMKCEGDKIYEAPGRCPVCGMHLMPVK